MQTPKGLAKALVSRALARPELNLRVRRYPQVPGTFGASRDVLFPMENTYRNIAFAPYWFWGGFREVALGAMFYHEVISTFDLLESSRDFMSANGCDRAVRNDAQRAPPTRLGFSGRCSECGQCLCVRPRKSWIRQVLVSRTLSVCGEVAERLKAAVC